MFRAPRDRKKLPDTKKKSRFYQIRMMQSASTSKSIQNRILHSFFVASNLNLNEAAQWRGLKTAGEALENCGAPFMIECWRK